MYILFDIGGSKMRVTAGEDGLTFGEPLIFDTPEYFKDGIAILDKAIESIAKGKTITAISGAVAGVLNRETGTILRAPNLRGWENNSLKQFLIKHGSNIYLENDAALAGLGEAVHGAGKNHEIVAFMTISTGIGGARIIHKNIDSRRVGFEPGQQIIDAENLTSLENRISGRALQKKYRKEPKEITDDTVWKRAADDLAIGIHNAILHWSPDVFILGGPMILRKPGIDIEEVKRYLASVMYMFPALPEIYLSLLGDKAGLVGAHEYMKQQS